MRSGKILAATTLAAGIALAALPAFAQQYPKGRSANDGGIASEPTGAPQYNGNGQVVASPGNEIGSNNCAERFHSYDPSTGTYLGFDGQRHACP